mmetsp:Transcript_1551/g.3995  ORF Transcript_1551/g.3995 Transcript_1551/m.3995 type:complete len:185 (+) Transcript_1551:63-617(+)
MVARKIQQETVRGDAQGDAQGDALQHQTSPLTHVDRLSLSRFQPNPMAECVQADLASGAISPTSSEADTGIALWPDAISISTASGAAQSRGNRRRVKQRERRRLYKGHNAEQDAEEAPTEYTSTGSESQDSRSMGIAVAQHRSDCAGQITTSSAPWTGCEPDGISSACGWDVPPTRLASLATWA